MVALRDSDEQHSGRKLSQMKGIMSDFGLVIFEDLNGFFSSGTVLN